MQSQRITSIPGWGTLRVWVLSAGASRYLQPKGTVTRWRWPSSIGLVLGRVSTQVCRGRHRSYQWWSGSDPWPLYSRMPHSETMPLPTLPARVLGIVRLSPVSTRASKARIFRNLSLASLFFLTIFQQTMILHGGRHEPCLGETGRVNKVSMAGFATATSKTLPRTR